MPLNDEEKRIRNAEKQRRYREKRKRGVTVGIYVTLPLEQGNKLGYLATHWQMTKTDVIAKLLADAWKEAGEPIYDRHTGQRVDQAEPEVPAEV